MILFQLFVEFFKTGLFALGGGLATLPFLYSMADTFHWFTQGDIVNMLAISESTPGAIGVNMSTYSGYHIAGVPGSLIATFGLVLPSVIIIILVARVLESFKNNRYVEAGFYGIRPVVAGLICAATLSVFKVAFLKTGELNIHKILFSIDFKSVILFVILYMISKLAEKRGRSIHPIFLIVLSGCIGVAVLGV